MQTSIDLPPGLVTNDTNLASEGRYVSMSGARFYDGKPQSLGGYESIATTKLSGVCRTAHQWTDNAGNGNLALGRHNGLDVYYGGTVYDITPLAFVSGNIDGAGSAGYGTGAYGLGTYGTATSSTVYPMTWSFSNYGQTLIANPRGQGIYQWSNNTATKAVAVTNAPTACTFALVVPQRQIVAFGCTDLSASFDPMCIRGSDIENITQWTPTTSNNAFEYRLDNGSRIVCARVVANYLMVWTDSSFYLGTFIGAPDETWRFELQGKHCGAIGPNAPVIDGQRGFWPSPDGQFWTAPIGGAPENIPCEIQTDFAKNLAVGQNDKVVGSTISRFREIRWFYADGRDGYEISRSVAVNADGHWSADQSQPRTAYVDANPSTDPIGVTYAGNIYWQERGTTGDGGTLSGWLETGDFALGDPGDDLMEIRGCWPDVKDQLGTLNLTVYTRNYPQDTHVRTRGPYTLVANRSKRDFRATGRLARVRWDWNAGPVRVRLGKPTFDVVSAGQR